MVRTVETTPVSAFVAVILTPGISAFAASETVPLKLALLDCPNTDADRLRKKKHVARPKHVLFLMVDPPFIPRKSRPEAWSDVVLK